MAKVDSAFELYLEQRARFARVGRKMKDVMEWNARSGRDDLRKLTSGRVTTSQLRRLRHPYGRTATPTAGVRVRRRMDPMRARKIIGRTTLPPYPINVQTGKLRNRIYLRRLRAGVFEIGSSAPYAKFQFSPWGTLFMIRRGVMGGRALNASFPPGRLELAWRMRNRVIRDAIRRGYR